MRLHPIRKIPAIVKLSNRKLAEFKCVKTELVVYGLAALLVWLWFSVTDSYTSEEPLHSFYQPLLRSLQILKLQGLAGFEQIIATHHGPYPYGIYFFPVLFHYLGLNFLFSSHPEMIVILQLFCWAVLCYLLFSNSRQSILLFLLGFTFPLFSISIKSFSPHSWNVLLGFFFIFFFRRYERQNTHTNLLFCLFSGILAVSIKHFGFLLIAIFFTCQLWTNFCFPKKKTKLIMVGIFVLSIGLLFYPPEQLKEYISLMFAHHHYFRITHALWIILIFLILSALIAFLVRHNHNQVSQAIQTELSSPQQIANSSLKPFAGRPLFILFHLLTIWLYFLYGVPLFLESAHLFYPFLFFLFLLAIFNLMFCIKAHIALYALFYASLGQAYFLYLFAHHIDFFVFPLALLFFLAIKENISVYFSIFLISGNLFVSNLCPSLHQIEVNCGFPARDACIRLFSSTSWHPWSWSYNPIKKIAKNMQSLLQPYINQKELFGLSCHLSFKTQQELNWPPYFMLDQLPDNAEKVGQEISNIGLENIFYQWLTADQIPIIVEALPEWSSQYIYEPAIEPEKLLADFIPNEHPESKAYFVQLIGEAWMNFLIKKNLLEQYYDTFLLPENENLVKMYILKTL